MSEQAAATATAKTVKIPGPDHPITIEPNPNRVVVSTGGTVLADIRWDAARSVDVTFNFFGSLLDLKGFPGHHRPKASVDVRQPHVVMQRLDGDPDDPRIFTKDRVWIERRDGWSVEERSDPRAAFAGHRRETPWDRLHLTYFLGYAVWNYLAAPFLFAWPGFNSQELDRHVEGRSNYDHNCVAAPVGRRLLHVSPSMQSIGYHRSDESAACRQP
jgi:hypothetical protein